MISRYTRLQDFLPFFLQHSYNSQLCICFVVVIRTTFTTTTPSTQMQFLFTFSSDTVSKIFFLGPEKNSQNVSRIIAYLSRLEVFLTRLKICEANKPQLESPPGDSVNINFSWHTVILFYKYILIEFY